MSDPREPLGKSSAAWFVRYRIVLAVTAVVVAIGIWTAIEQNSKNDRKEAGFATCEDAVRDGLIDGYNPGLDVDFEEEQPSGDLAYTVLSDDGDGQWTCTVDTSGEPLVVDGLVYDD